MVESNKRLYYERRFFQYFLSIGISEKDLKENWYYAGGRGPSDKNKNISLTDIQEGETVYTKNNHINFFLISHGDERDFPPYKENCKCSKYIKENCYISDRKGNFFVVGNCCIQRFLFYKKRTCEICDSVHKNVKDNFCNKCRNTPIYYQKVEEMKKRIFLKYFPKNLIKIEGKSRESIIDEWERELQTIFLKNFTNDISEIKLQIYFDINFSEKERGKRFGMKWDSEKVKWYGTGRSIFAGLFNWNLIKPTRSICDRGYPIIFFEKMSFYKKAYSFLQNLKNIYFFVPYDLKEIAKSSNLKYEDGLKIWFIKNENISCVTEKLLPYRIN